MCVGMSCGGGLKQQGQGGVYKEESEEINHTIKSSDQANAREDEGCAHGDGADDSPEQNSVLHGLGQIERAEDEGKDKKIVGAEGEVYNVAGGEFEGGGVSLPDGQQSSEGCGDSAPQSAPDKDPPRLER